MITPLTSRSNKRKKNKTLILFGICLALLLTCGQVAMAAAAPAGTTPEKEQQAEKTAFTDVASDNPLWPYVHYLVAKGLFQGYPAPSAPTPPLPGPRQFQCS